MRASTACAASPPALVDDESMGSYQLFREHHERCPTVFTSNRDLAEWCPLFDSAPPASAAMDRLLHHGAFLVLDGRSHRTASKAGCAQGALPDHIA